MSALKQKSLDNSQRSSSVKNRSRNRSKSKQKDEINNDSKSKLLEQLQNNSPNLSQDKLKTNERLDNAKKLKKIILNSIYSNRDSHNNLFHSNNQNNSSIINNYSINNSQNQDSSTSTLKIVKINQQFSIQNGKDIQSYKQRSTSVQKEYQKGLKKQPHYTLLNCIPNDSQSKINNSSYQQLFNQVNKFQSEQEQQLKLFEKSTLNSKKKVKFTNMSSQQNENENYLLSPTHQCFHKDGCPKKYSKIDLNKDNIQSRSRSKESLGHENEMQETGKFANQLDFDNINQEFNSVKQINQIKSEQNNDSSTKKFSQTRENKQKENISQKNLKMKNSPQHFYSSKKQNESFYSSNNSGKKQGYQKLIENDMEKLEILKKIQNQKDQITEISKQQGISYYKEINKYKDRIISSKKPPQNPQYLQNQHPSSVSIKNKSSYDNLFNQCLKQNTPQIGKSKLYINIQDYKDTIQKQRSVSSQQQQIMSSSKRNQNDRSLSKDRNVRSSDKSLKIIQIDNDKMLNNSQDKQIPSSQQKITDLQSMIQRIKIQNNTQPSNLEIKKLEEQLENDKLNEKQILDFKSQQKTIYIFSQEKELLQEQSDSFENKFKLMQSKNKQYEKIRLDQEDQIQKQRLLVQETQKQINESQFQYSELSRRHNILKKQYDELEKEKNRINVEKQKMENEAQQKIEQYKCMNQQNFDLTIEFERKNKENQCQINQLIEKVNNITQQYDESSKNELLLENKYRASYIVLK